MSGATLPVPRRTASTVSDQLAKLDALSRDALAERWAAQFGCPPPPGVRRELLLHAAAFDVQTKHGSGLAPDARRMLKRAVAGVAQKTGRKEVRVGLDAAEGAVLSASSAATTLRMPERRTLSSGARLLRDWNGVTHVVDVVDNGFVFQGTRHRSLSAIAKLITGAHWSGPRFFGL
ncbi:DUF2924 domain-containing protein [Mesorhizobium sp. RP14(2022)]|uniref:DUF2924 domain-containing protein n=1 Tax=Mesorhizobium liriopis TaxID=2953882 RepID=A0ABT1C8G3_9HYPH|nr:DUF2924 domain-containing protein [Mesorhizobium liriopis]MCO6050480.1 DUF2924 domain-containing protein [Mesorhizobium liriopis]